jgi:hypothetical protein
VNTNIQIMASAKMDEPHRPIKLTPEQERIVRTTPADELFLALSATGLRDFVIIQDNTPGWDLTPEQIATKIGVPLEEYLEAAKRFPSE